ncbi:thioredoxin family protein [Citrobacter koseri]|uniref:thioredoxin family protein n=1 Tax=Citrobacter koseri TaxID=545 RepID=UPI001EFA258E|nr:thioredoxin family protein [Citrobacter koseri]
MEKHYLTPEKDADKISKMLNEGQRLVACFCADWCSSCQAWRDNFSRLAQKSPEDCFVWLDIDKHPDMIADIDLDILPVMLVQNEEKVYFLGTIKPELSIVEKIIQSKSLIMNVQKPGIRDFLLEDGVHID